MLPACSVDTQRVSNITYLLNHICAQFLWNKPGENLPRVLFSINTNTWGSFLGIFIWKKNWGFPMLWEKLSSLHPSAYVNTQLAPRFIPALAGRRPILKKQQRRKWTHTSREYKIILPPQVSCSTGNNCFILHVHTPWELFLYKHFFPKQIERTTY